MRGNRSEKKEEIVISETRMVQIRTGDKGVLRCFYCNLGVIDILKTEMARRLLYELFDRTKRQSLVPR